MLDKMHRIPLDLIYFQQDVQFQAVILIHFRTTS